MMGYTFTLIYAVVLLIFFLGLIYFLWTYLRTPVPLNIALTPGSSTVVGVLWKMVKEVLFFETLFHSSKWTWLFGWLFHFGLLFVILRHLSYFTDPVWVWVRQIEAYSDTAAVIMIVGLTGLLVRRVFVDRLRYISVPSDYLHLILLLTIAINGMLMTHVFGANIPVIKSFFRGLMVFEIRPFDVQWLVYLHLSLVSLLILVFPFSKLTHAISIFLNPVRSRVIRRSKGQKIHRIFRLHQK